MKAKLFQIVWHAKADEEKVQPILSLDAHPVHDILATAGADAEVRFWAVTGASAGSKAAPAGAGAASSSSSSASAAAAPAAAGAKAAGFGRDVRFLFTSTAHTATVNAVRFSPNGAHAGPAGLDDGRGARLQPPTLVARRCLCFPLQANAWRPRATVSIHARRNRRSRLPTVCSHVVAAGSPSHRFALRDGGLWPVRAADETLIIQYPHADHTWLTAKTERSLARVNLKA